jgi:hypothetical protein
MGFSASLSRATGDGLAIIGRREIAATLDAGKARVEVISVKINHVDLDAATLRVSH